MISSFITRVEHAIATLKSGKMVILTDHPDRENEGDIIFPAEILTNDVMHFMIKEGSGIVCLSMHEAFAEKFGLNLMVPRKNNASQQQTPFTISIEAANGITTGVSVQDRVKTILTVVNPASTKTDIVSPGHVFPLLARQGGVFDRKGHTEGSTDLMRLAGFQPAAVICEIMNPDGTMAAGPQLNAFADKHNITMLAIDDLVDYRRYQENLIDEIATVDMPLEKFTGFEFSVLKEKYTNKEHIVLMKNCHQDQTPLVRVHSACITGDLFHSQRCDCGRQLDYSLAQINEQGGILIYLAQEGRDIGLLNKIKAYRLQDQGVDTFSANAKLGLPVDGREYYFAASVLRHFGVNKIRLLTNNPYKVRDLKKYGIHVESVVSLPAYENQYNQRYLHTKQQAFNAVI